MDATYVDTMKELKAALKQKSEKIVVRGELANKLKPLAKIKRKTWIHVKRVI